MTVDNTRLPDPHSPDLSIAMIGTRGVPAHYGGFETCVEEVGARLADRGHAVTVYCRTPAADRPDAPTSYRGMNLVHLGSMKRRSLETLSHTGLSVAHLMRHRTDVAIVFNSANAPWLPFVRAGRVPVATHVDGLEWQRGKWGPTGRRYYRIAERAAVKLSDALIADAAGIADYYREKYDAATDLISYGAPVVGRGDDRLAEVGLSADGYHLVVARFEPENHVDLIVQGYAASGATLPLVVVGSAPYSDAYTTKVHRLADGRVRFLGGVWDQTLLDQLYANARSYLHGHSVGGTNPSLLRALGASAPIDAFDVGFNREVLGEAGRYFRTSADVAQLIEQSELDPDTQARRGRAALRRAARYDWDLVADGYEAMCRRLAAGSRSRSARSGRTTAVLPAGRVDAR